MRERTADIAPLACFFLEQEDPKRRFSQTALRALEWYDWPGNVRELRNMVIQATVMAERNPIEADDLPLPAGLAPRSEKPATLEDMEREMILKVLNEAGGRQQPAADVLGISLRTLGRKLKAYSEQNFRVPPGCEPESGS